MWVLQTVLSAVFICTWIPLQNMNVIGMLSTTINSPRAEARYPNPLKEHDNCHRRRPSYVCNPDNLLSWEEADRLDFLLKSVQNTTPCLCPACPVDSPGGISIGIFLKENLTHEERSTKGFTSKRLATILRDEWKLGKCDDDIIIVLIAEEKRSAISLGSRILSVLPYHAAEEIAKECDGHFESNYTYFPQGLKAMVYSFHDILQQSPRRGLKFTRRKNIGIIIGISLGVIVVIILIVSGIILVWHQFQKRKISKPSNASAHWKKPEPYEYSEYSKSYGYTLCKMENFPMNNNTDESSSDSDEENQSASGDNGTDVLPQKQGMYRKRELSDVPEEAEDTVSTTEAAENITPATDESNTEVPTFILNNNRSMEVTEL